MIAAFAAVYVIWGSTYAAIRVVVEQLPPLFTSGFRFVVAGAVLYAIARVRRESPLTVRECMGPAASGLLMLTASHGLVCWGEQTMPSSLAAVLMATMPIWMVLLSWLLFQGQRPQRMTLAGLVAGVVGVSLLVPSVSSNYPASGLLALLGAPPLWALGALVATRFGASSSTLRSTSVQMLVGGGALAMVGLLRGETPPHSFGQASPHAWLAFAYLVVFGAIVGFGAYRWLLQNVGPAAASTHAFVNPMVAVVLGAALLGETLSARTAMGGGLIVLAVVFVGADRFLATQFPRNALSDCRRFVEAPLGRARPADRSA